MSHEGTKSHWVYAMLQHISCAPTTRISVQCQAELRNGRRTLASKRRKCLSSLTKLSVKCEIDLECESRDWDIAGFRDESRDRLWLTLDGYAGDAKQVSLQLKDAKWDERTGPTGESQMLCDLFHAFAVAPLTELEMFFDPGCCRWIGNACLFPPPGLCLRRWSSIRAAPSGLSYGWLFWRA